MSLLYTNTHRIKFTSITDKYKVLPAYKGKLSELHGAVIQHVSNNFIDTRKFKQSVVDALNLLTYAVYTGEALPATWKLAAPLDTIPEINRDIIESELSDIYLTIDGIEWDVSPKIYQDSFPLPEVVPIKNDEPTSALVEVSSSSKLSQKSANADSCKYVSPIIVTDKQDLYIQSPAVPQFDYSKPYIVEQNGADTLVIYTTLPEIPTKQNEISVTTNINKMRDSEFYALYPKSFVQTRANVMYEAYPKLKLHPELGLVIPIEGFTEEQVIDNIIKYPHLFKLTRQIGETVYSLYSHIEVDGQLKGTLDVWDTLPEASLIPKQTEFIKEYVARRYLLERDNGVHHNYPMLGDLDPFLTLFMPSDKYLSYGYTDTLSIAKQCVASRIRYKQSRNPILRRLNN